MNAVRAYRQPNIQRQNQTFDCFSRLKFVMTHVDGSDAGVREWVSIQGGKKNGYPVLFLG